MGLSLALKNRSLFLLVPVLGLVPVLLLVLCVSMPFNVMLCVCVSV